MPLLIYKEFLVFLSPFFIEKKQDVNDRIIPLVRLCFCYVSLAYLWLKGCRDNPKAMELNEI